MSFKFIYCIKKTIFKYLVTEHEIINGILTSDTCNDRTLVFIRDIKDIENYIGK